MTRMTGSNLLWRCVAPLSFLALLALAAIAPRAADEPASDTSASGETPPALNVLFLGDDGHHRPADRFKQIEPVLRGRNIKVTYSGDPAEALRPDTLRKYDALLLYANIDRIEPDQEKALLAYVEGGGGFVPLHCASFCFRNSDKVVELVGAQFLKHETGVFRTTIVESDHPIMKGFGGFESWDETYVHTKHNERDRTVLSVREDSAGREPWTWVRTSGKGRVFYTAWGHDERTWGHPGFQNLLERGIRWAAGGDPSVVPPYGERAAFQVPEMNPPRTDVAPFEFVDAELPFYPAGERWGTIGKPISKMQKPLAAEESLKHYVVPKGYHLELFAADPDIAKPICMAWDERGRLWLGETVDYPNELQSPGSGHDRIRICEDTDGDGRADKFTVFADGLSIPSSLVFSQGGVIAHQVPRTVLLKDTDGDDKADSRTVLLEGWGTYDTHAGPSNMHYGLDNWIWGTVGYSGFDGRVGGDRQRFGQGFLRFRPDGSTIEFARSTNNNTWGLGISEEGLIFGSTANGNPSEYMPIANRYYEAVRGWSVARLEGIAGAPRFRPITDDVRQVDNHGGYTAAAGHDLYTARTWPEQYWNRTAFVAEPTGHLISTFVLSQDGSGFQSVSPCNLLASDDEWAAPIAAAVGPDGQVWVIDWYNIIVQHNPTPVGYRTGKGNAYEIPLRDKTHGRIYRLVYDGPGAIEAKPAMSLAGASPEKLVATLKNDNMLWRLHAQRLLVERGKLDVVPALIEMVGDKSVDSIGLNTAAVHALWTLQGLGALDGSHADATAAVVADLKHPSAAVRENAAAVLPRTDAGRVALLDSSVLDDDEALVRMRALLALSEMPPDEKAGAAIAQTLADAKNAEDRWIPDAATSAAATNDVYFLRAVLASGAIETGAEAAQTPPRSGRRGAQGGGALAMATAIVAEHFARGGSDQNLGALLAALSEADPAAAEAVLAGMARGWPRTRKATLDEAAQEATLALFARVGPGGQGNLIGLASRWGSPDFSKHAEKVAGSLLALAADEKQPEARRIEAAQQLVSFRASDAEVADNLLDLVSPRVSPELAGGLIAALSASQADEIGAAVVKRYGSLTPSARGTAIGVLMSRPAWTAALLEGLENGSVALADLSLDQKQSLSGHPDRDIAARARKLMESGGGLPDPDREKVFQELLALTEKKGDPALGKEVFTKQCAKCHTHGDEGKNIGPDLTGMAVHPKAELLVNIIDPSRSVEGNFREYTVILADGRVLRGLLAAETATAIELFDPEGEKHVVLREDIDELIGSNKSLMPDGFEKQVQPEEIVNLLEFLTQKGKYLPLDLRKVATIVSTRGMFYDENAGAERLIFSDWSPKTFENVPFHLVDPQGQRVPNVIMLYGPQGKFPPTMPKSVTLPCNSPAAAIHLLSGVSGWGAQGPRSDGTISMIVRLHYADGETEDHPLRDGVHFADYIGRFDVPESKRAFTLRGQQIRYLAVKPKRSDVIESVELVKGEDRTAPVVMAVTVETPDGQAETGGK